MYYVRGGSQIDLTSISYFRLLQYDDNSEKIETQSEEVPVHVRDVFKSGDSDRVGGDSSENAKTQSMIKLKEWRSIIKSFLLKPSKNKGRRQMLVACVCENCGGGRRCSSLLRVLDPLHLCDGLVSENLPKGEGFISAA